LVELPSHRGAEAARAKAVEATAILDRVKATDRLVALDELGKTLTSHGLAELINQSQIRSHSLVFCIGGDQGLGKEIIDRSSLSLSLSRFTLPHRLARLVLMEQLYRAFTILRGEAYHK
jgi:23S rRNA (pseudouridine1915-N3)-methyltransferase